MKRLKQYNGKMGSGIYKYLIESDKDLEEAIGDAILDSGTRLDTHSYGLDDHPGVYPCVVLIKPDDEYRRIDFAFVSNNDFINNDIGSLQSMLAELYNDTTMAPWIARIQNAQRQGEREVSFHDMDGENNQDNQYAVNDHQIEFIRNKGYKVSWEKHPRSYIVSGW